MILETHTHSLKPCSGQGLRYFCIVGSIAYDLKYVDVWFLYNILVFFEISNVSSLVRMGNTSLIGVA
jgi:hypothetical protein